MANPLERETVKEDTSGSEAMAELKGMLKSAHELSEKIVDNLERVIRGKRNVLELLVSALFAGGHVLIDDVPGLGKTTLAKSIANLIAANRRGKPVTFKRIQFTPDLLPYDITGVDIFDPENRKFTFSPGPVFANILLADEINRTTPKVQSALLEVMAENQVTVGNRTYKLDPLFFVIATENPVEMEGTYPLPLAQLDRFLIRMEIGYPDFKTEIEIINDDPSRKVLPVLKPVCLKEEILRAQSAMEEVHCDPRLIEAAVSISASTRKHRAVELGVSPRGSLMLVRLAKAYALVSGRNYVIDQDILDLAPLCLAHRLKMKDIKVNPLKIIREIAISEISKIKY